MPISCIGNSNMGTSVLLKLYEDDMFYDDEAITVPPMGVDWTYNWPKPVDNGVTRNWRLCVINKLTLWAGNPFIEQASNDFEFVDP